MFKKYIEKVVTSIIEDFIGKKPKQNSYNYMMAWADSFSLYFGGGKEEDESKGTGLFKKLSVLEDKIDAIEKFLKIEYKVEEEKFEGYKTVKKTKATKVATNKKNK